LILFKRMKIPTRAVNEWWNHPSDFFFFGKLPHNIKKDLRLYPYRRTSVPAQRFVTDQIAESEDAMKKVFDTFNTFFKKYHKFLLVSFRNW
jgi:hypothetical protein